MVQVWWGYNYWSSATSYRGLSLFNSPACLVNNFFFDGNDFLEKKIVRVVFILSLPDVEHVDEADDDEDEDEEDDDGPLTG